MQSDTEVTHAEHHANTFTVLQHLEKVLVHCHELVFSPSQSASLVVVLVQSITNHSNLQTFNPRCLYQACVFICWWIWWFLWVIFKSGYSICKERFSVKHFLVNCRCWVTKKGKSSNKKLYIYLTRRDNILSKPESSVYKRVSSELKKMPIKMKILW